MSTAAIVLGCIVCIICSVAHMCAAEEYGKKHGRPAFERFATGAFMLIGWPLFAIGMLFRGYGDFWEKTWGNKK